VLLIPIVITVASTLLLFRPLPTPQTTTMLQQAEDIDINQGPIIPSTMTTIETITTTRSSSTTTATTKATRITESTNNNHSQSNTTTATATTTVNHDDNNNTNNNSCFKVVTNTGGWGNRLGPLMCAIGLVNASNTQKLHVLWNAANEGTKGPAPRTAHTGRGGYSFTDIQKLIQVPFEWVVVMNATNTTTATNNEATTTTTKKSSHTHTFYGGTMAGNVQQWKTYFQRRGNPSFVQEYETQEDYFETLPCHNLPVAHTLPDENDERFINDYTPEPCWTRYQAFAFGADEQFHYLQKLMSEHKTKEDFVDSLIAQTRHKIRPKIDFCLPPKRSYIVLHARRGDRAAQAVVPNLLSKLEKLAPIVPLVIISENATVVQGYQQSSKTNFTFTSTNCTPRVLSKRHHVHRPTVGMLQDYFTMAYSAGIITDYSWDQSSFSTTAALGNGLPMLYPGSRHRQHSMNRFFAKDGNKGKPLRNVYYLNTLEEYVERVKEEMSKQE